MADTGGAEKNGRTRVRETFVSVPEIPGLPKLRGPSDGHRVEHPRP